MAEDNKTQNTEIKRQVAYKCNIMTLNKGVFVRRQGWESNYVMTDYGDFSRVNMIAVVVAKDENSITLDDGTGQIVARVFDGAEKLSKINIGEIILTIARPREFNEQIYLTIEIIKKIDNKAWVSYRKKELMLIKRIRTVESLKTNINKQENHEAEIIESPNTVSSKDKIMRLIMDMDNGQGADIDDVIRLSKVKNAEGIVQDMLLRGDVFEIKPGKLNAM